VAAGTADRSSAVLKRGVEAVLAAPVGFVVGFDGHESDRSSALIRQCRPSAARGAFKTSLTRPHVDKVF
jgi:hypothetical protein